MSQLVAIKQKINAAKTTKKITHAIRLVSMSLYARLERQNKSIDHYAKTIQETIAELVHNIPASSRTSRWWLMPTQDTNPLVIIIGSSKGLCGGLNTRLFDYVRTRLALYQKPPACIAVGQKTINFFKDYDLQATIIANYRELSSHNVCALADILISHTDVPENPYTSITVISSRMKSFFVQYPTHVQLYPLQAELFSHTSAASWEPEQVLFEPSRQELLDHLAFCYLKSALKNLLFQGLRAEQAARFLAMEKSTTNAEKYLAKLTLQYNKLRQAQITKEVSELSATFGS